MKLENEKTIEPNVLNFLKDCSIKVGQKKSESFESDVYYFIIENEINSPIEQMFLCELHRIREINDIQEACPERINDKDYLIGFGIFPQFQIGKYRVDFFLEFNTYHWVFTNKPRNQLIVECDSQEWHERTERERSYEKTRDRFLQKIGYTVFHYTGSEIYKNSENIALEIISYLTEIDKDRILK